MSFDIQKRNIFNRRIFVVGFIKGLLFLLVFARLGFLQLFSHKKYSDLAKLNGVKFFFRLPKRGNIVDRNGNILAESKLAKSVVFTGSLWSERGVLTVKKTYEILYDGIGDKVEAALKKAIRFARNNPYIDVMIYKNLNKDEFKKLSFYLPMLNGIEIQDSYRRFYNFSDSFAHVLGYVKNANKDMIDKAQSSLLKKLYRYVNYYIGSSGVELAENSWLAGRYGMDGINTNIRGRVISKTRLSNEVAGNDLSLTFDLGLQLKAAELFDGKMGGVCVMDIKTGEILSLYSSPSFDPNLFSLHDPSEFINDIMSPSKNKPFLNRPISGLYAPGSTLKPCVAASAVHYGWDPESKVHCPGYVTIAGRQYHCHKKEGHGWLNLKDAVAKSCNVYFYTIGSKMDIDEFEKDARDLGYNTAYDIGIGKSGTGCIPSRVWKKKALKDNWYLGDTVNTSIGQGYSQVNILQMCVHAARIASGKKITPIIWKDFIRKNNLDVFNKNQQSGKVDFEDVSIDKNALDVARYGMYSCVNVEGGAMYARALAAKILDSEICGKTGTAQVVSRRIDAEQMKAGAATTSHGLFFGYAPYSNPKYAVSIVVEHGIWGSVSAGPIGLSLLDYCVKKNVS